jgi:hypothetical protein
MQSSAPDAPPTSLHAFIKDVRNTITAACALLDSGRPVDLTGLDQRIGFLCAQVLALPPAEGRSLRPALAGLLAAAEGLSDALAAGSPGR